MSEARFFHDSPVPVLVEQIRQIPLIENAVVLLLIGEHSSFDVQELWTALKAQQIPICGGVFPGLIFGDQRHEAGIVASVLPVFAEPSVVTQLDTPDFRLGVLPELPSTSRYTALVFVDGLTKHVALFLDRLFGRLGNHVSYIGGGAGSLSLKQMPCVFDSHGFYQDAALIIWLKAKSVLGVRHGWQSLRGPFVATQTDGTIVYKLYKQPALQVYRQTVASKSDKQLTKESFFEIAREYPLGIFHPKMDFIVRDPIAFTENEGLVCIGEVPPRSLLYILRGDRPSLIENAHLAATEAIKSAGAGQYNLIVDCISRVLYLEDEFSKELKAVLDALPENAARPFGVLSLGEIATFKTGRVEFFNKTIVVGALHTLP